MEKITRQVIMKVFSALHLGAGSFRGGGGNEGNLPRAPQICKIKKNNFERFLI
jgi:hypothetical protein